MNMDNYISLLQENERLLEENTRMTDFYMRNEHLSEDGSLPFRVNLSDVLKENEMLRGQLDAAQRGRNYWKAWCKWFYASRRAIMDDRDTLERELSLAEHERLEGYDG